MIDEKTQAAFHEAGHAVVAASRGFSVVRLRILRNEEAKRWDGDMQRPPGTANPFEGSKGLEFVLNTSVPLNEIAIAIAGCLAQAKSVAESVRCANVRFSPEFDVGSFIAWMSDENVQGLEPYPIPFVAVDSNDVVNVVVQPRWFGGCDRGVYLTQSKFLSKWAPKSAQSRVAETLAEVTHVLDDAAFWGRVSRIAQELVRRCDNMGATLEANVCHELLNA